VLWSWSVVYGPKAWVYLMMIVPFMTG